MSRNPSNPQQAPEEKVLEQIDDFLSGDFGRDLSKSRIEQIFTLNEIHALRFELARMIQSAAVTDVTKYLEENVKPLLNEIGENKSDFENLNGQIYTIKRHELKPAEINVLEKAQSLQFDVPFEGRNVKGGYFSDRSDIPGIPSSIIGGTSRARNTVRKRRHPISRPELVDSTYRNLVVDEQSACQDDLRISYAKFDAFLKGREFSDKDAQNLTKWSTKHRALSNLAEGAAFAGFKATSWLGRGVISHSKAAEDKDFIKFQNEIDAWLARDRFISGAKSGRGTAYLFALKEMYKKLANTEGVLNPAEFSAMQTLISEAIKAEEKVNEDELKKFNEEVGKQNKAMLDAMKGVVKKDDDLWKYKVAQVFLILSPLGFFNYMVPVANLLGPLFASGMSFGEGLGAIATSPVLGPFGDIAAAIKLDVAIAAVFDNVPVVSDIGGVFNSVTDSDVAQNLFGVVSPSVTGSPLLPIAIAVVFSLNNQVKYNDQSDKRSQVVKDADKKLRALFEDFEKVAKNDKRKERIMEFANKELEANMNIQFFRDLVNFICKAEPEELVIFDKVKIGGKAVRELLVTPTGPATPSQMMDILLKQADPAARKSLLDNFFVYRSISEEKNNDKDQALTQFKTIQASADQMKAMADKETVKNKQEYIIDLAENELGLSSIYDAGAKEDPEYRKSDEYRKDKATDYIGQIVQARLKARLGMSDIVRAEKEPQPKPKQPLHANPVGPAVQAAGVPIPVR